MKIKDLTPGLDERLLAIGLGRGMSAEIIHGDALDVLRGMESGSVDAIVTDPPAGIGFMGKQWDKDKGGRREWIAWLASVMAEGLRVLKPGGYAFVWALPRTSHWTATALEDAGFEIRDVVHHVFGSGFPKSKALLKPAAENWILARKPGPLRHLRIDECRVGLQSGENPEKLASRSGGSRGFRKDGYVGGAVDGGLPPGWDCSKGRWPANFVMSHSPPVHDEAGNLIADGCERVPAWRCAEWCPVALMDEQSGVRTTHAGTARSRHRAGLFGLETQTGRVLSLGDTGTASRFFHCFDPDPFVYQAKASRRDRGEGNKHPTVKSTALMRHLCRLIAAPGDLVLDPFAGSGSTGVACLAEGMRFIGIEREGEYVEIARDRITGATPFQRVLF